MAAQLDLAGSTFRAIENAIVGFLWEDGTRVLIAAEPLLRSTSGPRGKAWRSSAAPMMAVKSIRDDGEGQHAD
jgi:hypothetical protein